MVCPHCEGDGFLLGGIEGPRPCGVCRGSGRVEPWAAERHWAIMRADGYQCCAPTPAGAHPRDKED